MGEKIIHLNSKCTSCFLPISASVYLFLFFFFYSVIRIIFLPSPVIFSTSGSLLFHSSILIYFHNYQRYYFIYIPLFYIAFRLSLPTMTRSHSPFTLSFPLSPLSLPPSVSLYLSISHSHKLNLTFKWTYNNNLLCCLQILLLSLMPRDLGLHKIGCTSQPAALRCKCFLDPPPLHTTSVTTSFLIFLEQG